MGRLGTLSKTAAVLAVTGSMLSLVAWSQDGEPERQAVQHILPPVYRSVAELAHSSSVVVAAQVGKFDQRYLLPRRADTPGLAGSPQLAYDVWEAQITHVVAGTGVTQLQSVRLGTFAVEGGSPELVKEIASYTTPLQPGMNRVFFLAPFEFVQGVQGYAIVGGDNGVFTIYEDGLETAFESADVGQRVIAQAPSFSPISGDSLGSVEFAQVVAANVGNPGAPRRPEPVPADPPTALVPTTQP